MENQKWKKYLDIFSKNVRKLRQSNNLTIEQLSEISNISPDFLSKIELGKRTASFQTIVSLADSLKVKPSLLFLSEDDTELTELFEQFNKYIK